MRTVLLMLICLMLTGALDHYNESIGRSVTAVDAHPIQERGEKRSDE